MSKDKKIPMVGATKVAIPSTYPSDDDFNWADSSVVLQEQRAIAIYRNEDNSIVIRQERYWDEDNDRFIVITKENLAAFMEALSKYNG